MELEVRIERLEPMKVARFQAIGESPEAPAFEKLKEWAEANGLFGKPQEHPVFGFNNPTPADDRKEYGYEFWIRIPPELEAKADVKEFPGGRYAVVTHPGIPNPKVWLSLWNWVKASEYTWRRTHELEKPHDPWAAPTDLVFDLFLPIEE
jgi:DNA gyrase inhibitor GyrI